MLLPLAALVWSARGGGLAEFWHQATEPEAIAALKLTLGLAAACAAVNAVAGTATAWVLVRDRFPGKGLVDAVIDLPFALPTIVAGADAARALRPGGPFGIDVAFTRIGILMALLFVTLPFVVRAVQPVLIELDEDMEDAAASLGAAPSASSARSSSRICCRRCFRASRSAFARAVGEFGAVVLISGNMPFKTEVSSVYIFGQLQSGDGSGAAAVSCCCWRSPWACCWRSAPSAAGGRGTTVLDTCCASACSDTWR